MRYGTNPGNLAQYSKSSMKKKKKYVKQVNEEYLKIRAGGAAMDIEIRTPIAAEMDERWSFYHDKSHPIWLWWAVDHATNMPLAFTLGTRERKYLDELFALLETVPIGIVYADNNYAYQDKLPPGVLISGKKIRKKSNRITLL